ncbi:tripartite tricarboxylate transporter substrate binding protein [Geomicrobium sp. JCM 19055]|uniref:tripartite tricarboxylate transporter substrate binding protein n=1 Tax=Geomicrobium sp. JCM 19055 TaxID=1460649 RepID=UPI00045ED591|nr:tripartite tricarboxylate transporter substrate-binding protein [Geomicrobium sp. JCM 19055]GAJ98502.1 tricarboxylate transport protein TctC [Geomicrobium sp. JCM 19055]
MKKLVSVSASSFLTLVMLSACSDNGSEEAASSDQGEWSPTNNLEFVAPAGAGGGWDTTARMAAQAFEEADIVDVGIGVINREGGGGAVGWSYIANQAGDPHYLFAASPPLLLIPLNGQSEYSYEDFTPIANVIADFGAFAVRDDAPWQDLNELFEDMQDESSSITVVGESAPGSMDHVQFVNIAKAAGVDPGSITYVSAQDGSAMTNLLNGSVDVYSTGVTETIEQVRAGEVRVLAVTAEERLEGDTVEDYPTAIEQGIDEVFVNWRGFFGPPDMTEAEVEYYVNAFTELNESEEWDAVRERYSWDEYFMVGEEYKQFLEEQNEEMRLLLEELDLYGESE